MAKGTVKKPKDISSILNKPSSDKIMRGGAPTKRGSGGHSPTKNGGRC